MRRIVAHVSVSQDGYFEGPDSDLTWQLFGPAHAPTPLRLVETRTFGNGVVMLHHERTHDTDTP